MTFNEFLEQEVFQLPNDKAILVSQLFSVGIILVVGVITVWVIAKITKRSQKKHGFDAGRARAISQISKYVIFSICFLLILNTLEININILLAGGGIILVGLGLGIQDVFKDFVSGVLLLFEGSVLSGDVVEVDGTIGKVDSIRIRTSTIIGRDNINLIIPNSKLTGDKIINWSHNREATRFKVTVGVAYGSDVELVSKILLEAAHEQKLILKKPLPSARFDDFGDSALIFNIFFWSKEMMNIEFVRSDLRFAIDKKFREKGITIPFPQRDVHIYEKK